MLLQPLRFILVALVRNDGTAEVKSLHPVVDHHFGRVDIFQGRPTVGRRERFHQSGDFRLRIFKTSLYGLQLLRLNERFVALDVDDHVVWFALQYVSLIAAVRAALVVRTGHDGLAAESFYRLENPFVIGGHEHVVHHAGYLLVHPLDDRLAAQHGQRLARKSCGSISCRNNPYVIHFLAINKVCHTKIQKDFVREGKTPYFCE